MHSLEATDTSSMMKLAVAVLAVLAVSGISDAYTVPRAGNGALADEIQDFVDIIPLNDMVAILMEYISEDAQVQLLIEYLHTEEFKSLISDIEAMAEVRDLLNYIQAAGVDVYLLVNKVNSYLGLQRLTPPASVMAITGGIRGLLDDIEAIYPVEKVHALYREKLATSVVFKSFVARLSSPSTQVIVDNICSNVNFHSLLVKAQKAGVDVAAIKKGLETVLGLRVSCTLF